MHASLVSGSIRVSSCDEWSLGMLRPKHRADHDMVGFAIPEECGAEDGKKEMGKALGFVDLFLSCYENRGEIRAE